MILSVSCPTASIVPQFTILLATSFAVVKCQSNTSNSTGADEPSEKLRPSQIHPELSVSGTEALFYDANL